MSISGRTLVVLWVVWTSVILAVTWWQWRQIMGPDTMGVVFEVGSPLAIAGRLAVVYSPMIVVTALWLKKRTRLRTGSGNGPA